jgi:low temperature requirement protein LtrA
MHNTRLTVETVQEDEGSTTLELFFDLVFVFALTQITSLMAGDLTGRGIVRGVLVMAIVWWCWVGYSWLGNLVKADEGVSRVAMFVAMAGMFLIALSVPESFADFSGGLSGPVVFAVGYLVVRGVHVVLMFIASADDAGLRRQVQLFGATMAGSTALLLVASQTSGVVQTLLWLAVVLVDYGGTLLIGNKGWRINSAEHFAERHGLIFIVALGESIVAIGLGVADQPVSWPIVVATMLGLSVSASLWWAYFDTAALRAHQELKERHDHDRVSMAQHAFTYLHLPMLVSIVLISLGLKKVLEYVGDESDHELSEPLPGVPLAALLGGVALFLVAHAAFGRRTHGAVTPPHLVLAVVLLAAIPLATQVPAIGALAGVATLLVILNAAVWSRERHDRADVRHRHREDAATIEIPR